MFFNGIADSEQLTILTMALDDHCRANGIDPSSKEREDVGRLIMSLFGNGAHSAEELMAALEKTMTRNEQHAHQGG